MPRVSDGETPRVLGAVWLPVDRAMLCLQDDTIFDAEEGQCPSCRSENTVALLWWLAREQAASRALSVVQTSST